MRKLFLSLVLIVIFCAGTIQTNASPQTSLSDIYKTGKASLNLELRITDENLPEGIFFQNPMEMTRDQEGNIYVVDYRAHHIKKFNAEGKFITLLGREGEGPGEFMGPYKLTFAKDRLAVYELMGRRLNTIDLDGNYIQNVLMNIGEGSLRGILALPNGNFVVEKEKSYFWSEDRPQDGMLFLFSPDLKSLKKIYETKILRNKYITEPERTNVPQPFYADMCWTTTPDGKIVIGFSETYEISLFDPEKGELFSFSHKHKPVKVTKQDKEDWLAGITYTRGGEEGQGAQDFVKKNAIFPNNKPPFHDIKVDEEGNILVFTPSPDKVSYFKYFDAFDPQGRFISRVEVVGDYEFQKNMPRLGPFFGAIATDEDDLYQISLYTLSK